MEKSLYSPNWYRAESTRPRLRSHARIHRHHYRGQLWYVLQDRTSGRFMRFSPAAYLVISLMNGQRTLQEIWDIACERLGDDVLTQDEMIALVAQLHQGDVLRGDGIPDLEESSERARRISRRKKIMGVINPLAVRIPLFDPDAFVTRTLPLVRPILSWIGALTFIVVVTTAAVLAALNWPALTNNIADRVLAAESLAMLLLTYPFVKAVHELGHGYVLKRWGGEVHEMGIMFLVFMPVPYVDASDTAALREKWRRAFVGAAGIMVEAFLAAIALFIWLNAEEGMVRAVAFNVMVIGGVSTLLFNGNPLLRFDGYYVLSDLIEAPNLGTRSNRYLGYLIQTRLFGVEPPNPPLVAPGEARWLVFYSIASFCYRIFIMTVIVSLVATKFLGIGVLLAIWAVALMLGLPLVKQIRFLLVSPVLRRARGRAIGITVSIITGLIMIMMLLPMPYSTVTEGVVWTPDESAVHAGTAGVVSEVVATPNSDVAAGEPLFVLKDDFIDARVKLLEAQVAELRLNYEATDTIDPAEARIVQERLEHAEADLELTLERQRDLLVRSGTDGQFIVPRAADLPGRFVRQGDVLSYVSKQKDSVVRVVVPENQADVVRNRVKAVELKFQNRVTLTVPAIINREVPTLSNTLPSLALSTLGGGNIVLDPTDTTKATTVDRLLHLELMPGSTKHLPPLGSRVHVRFTHTAEPLAFRLSRGIRQVFLSRFNV
jgi:putative peptide zinc metalloprotease protein